MKCGSFSRFFKTKDEHKHKSYSKELDILCPSQLIRTKFGNVDTDEEFEALCDLIIGKAMTEEQDMFMPCMGCRLWPWPRVWATLAPSRHPP